VARERVHLAFVEMRDGFDIGAAVAVLHEEALVVLQAIRSADHGVVQAIGVVILHGLADALLVVRGGHDLQVFRQGQPRGLELAGWRLHHELEVVDAALEATLDDDLVFPAVGVFGEHAANGFVTLPVAADAFESRCDVEHFVADLQVLGELFAARRAESRGVALRQHDAVHLVGPERLHAQGRAHRAVDAARHGAHEAAAHDFLREELAQTRADTFDLTVVVQFKD
jgi:hypothetical protein